MGLTVHYRQRTLEELDQIFAVPTRRFVSYQCHEWLPHMFKKYVLFKRQSQLESLYHLRGFSSNESRSEVSDA
jgi:hypothetical protein